MVRAHEEAVGDKAAKAGRAPRPAVTAPVGATAGPVTPRTALALQRSVGNRAVSRLVDQNQGQDQGQDQHVHGAGCGHGGIEDGSPAGQRQLLDEAMASPSRPLGGSLLSEATAFYRNDLSAARIHDNPTAQRATVALGAQAMTVGTHVFLGPQAAGRKDLIGHELGHVDKNLRGHRETGNSNGAGVTVTDPGQDSERTAEADGAAFAAGAATAPSVVAQRAFAAGTGERDEAVQRSTEARDAPVQRAVDEALRSAGNPSEMMAALEASGHSKDDAWELMQYMTQQQFPPGEGQQDFDMLSHIKEAKKQRIPGVMKTQSKSLRDKKWTIRHYTGTDPNVKPSFQEVMTTYDNAAAGRAGANTNVADWRSLGNIKFTFYLMAVDGKVPSRRWLNNTHWYAEWDLDSIPDCWVSADLLARMNKDLDADGARAAMRGATAYRGSGTELKELLATKMLSAGNDPTAALDTVLGGDFELKVPGGLALPPSGWQKK
ncbi:DUF4157 domain-containing protein [Streptomyces sp. NPDC018321]|uniref:eCIS core domain-containing protein n=1 Tax=unclassified Streptomyces TaxID=2593676 RepID=UPI0037B76B39